ncbi:MAG TPA: hypothetical protein PL009_08735 [Flavipsychrobacter sp.]|nr:hypothetical protein [Flavipsychrobacter sp.]
MKVFLLTIMFFLSVPLCAEAQMAITVNNTISCDVNALVISYDGLCNSITNFGWVNIPGNQSTDFGEPNVSVIEFTIDIVVDPSGTPIVFPTMSTSGGCGGIPAHSDPTACAGGNVNASVGALAPSWFELLITP